MFYVFKMVAGVVAVQDDFVKHIKHACSWGTNRGSWSHS